MEFRYNRSFTERPSNNTDAAWRSIFPGGGGFFAHPEDDNARATFSVYHQLHCLVSTASLAELKISSDEPQDGLRYGYHLNREAALQGRQLLDEKLPWDMKPHHMRHCIDLIRQALMCNADTTLEVVDESVNGVHGFRTEHQCRDWRQLWEWTDRRQREFPNVVRVEHGHQHL